jgi:hypothetical protein
MSDGINIIGSKTPKDKLHIDASQSNYIISTDTKVEAFRVQKEYFSLPKEKKIRVLRLMQHWVEQELLYISNT